MATRYQHHPVPVVAREADDVREEVQAVAGDHEVEFFVVHDMEDDVIRGATVTHQGEITFPPPPPKVQAIAAKSKEKPKELTPEEKKAEEVLEEVNGKGGVDSL